MNISHMKGTRESGDSRIRGASAFIWIMLIGVATRLVLLSVSVRTDGGDPVTRTWAGWQWWDAPRPILAGVWGPLHFYLIGLSIGVIGDPVWAPILLNSLLSILTAALLFLFCRREIGDPAASLVVAVLYLVYPVATHTSLQAYSEPPFILGLALCLLLLSLAIERRSVALSAAAGIALTLAGMVRYESWFLTPFLAVLLPGRRMALGFLISSAIHPVLWLAGNGYFNGNPFFSFHGSTRWQLEIEGANSSLALSDLIGRVLYVPSATLLGLTPLVAALTLAGVAQAWKGRHAVLRWLLPAVGLAFVLTCGTVRGSLADFPRYTNALGLMLLPFAALALSTILKRIAGRGLLAAACIVLVVSVGITGTDTPLNPSRHLRHIWPRQIKMFPAFDRQDQARAIAEGVRRHLADGAAQVLISDFFGWTPTYYVALMTRLHPGDIFVAPGGRNEELRVERLASLIDRAGAGMLLTPGGTRFTEALGFEKGTAMLADIRLSVSHLETFRLGADRVYLYQWRVEAKAP